MSNAYYDSSSPDTSIGSRLAFRGRLVKASSAVAFKAISEVASVSYTHLARTAADTPDVLKITANEVYAFGYGTFAQVESVFQVVGGPAHIQHLHTCLLYTS